MVEEISALTQKFTTIKDIDAFMTLMHQHETIIAKATGLTLVQELLFPDFKGTIKSLGAWGGDFALFLSEEDFNINKEWFASKGYLVVMPLEEVIVNR